MDGRPICLQIAQEKFPAIVVGDHFEHPNLSFVYADSAHTSRQAVEHLVTLGHKRIAFAANEYEDGDHVDRYSAYCQTLEKFGLELDRSIVFRVPARHLNGAQLLRNLMSVPRPPTAVYVTDPPISVQRPQMSRRSSIPVRSSQPCL